MFHSPTRFSSAIVHTAAAIALFTAGHFFSDAIASEEPVVITVSGSTTILPVAEKLAADYMRQYPDVRVTVRGGGSTKGIDALIRGEVDIANSSRFISDQEIQQAAERNNYPVPFRIADDCIVPVVDKSNRLKDISRADLKGIFNGRITNWNQLGGPDLAITPVSRDDVSGTFDVWRQIVMDGDAVTTVALRKPSNAGVVKAVSRTPGAIGYIGLGYLSANVKPLRVDGVMGSLRSVRDGSYVINRPLFMFTRGWPGGYELEFINFVLDPRRGQHIIERSGFIPLYKQSLF